MTTLTELREAVGAAFCPTCNQDTLPLPNGRCGWCDRQLVGKRRERPVKPKDPATGRFVAAPPPTPLVVGKGCCLYCGTRIPGDARYKKLYCSDNHRHAYWVTYTPKGRESRLRWNQRRAA